MASVNADTDSFITPLGGGLSEILNAHELQPGDAPSYSVCKALFLFHPFGSKIAESPIKVAQSQDRDITISVASGIEDELVERFRDKWDELDASTVLKNLKSQSRVYGLASVGLGERGGDQSTPVELKNLWQKDLFFNIFDPLNTSGLIVDQNPNSPTFQKHGDLHVNGTRWHRSRTCTTLNESSIYLAWTSSAFAYAGRSSYQRAFFPLKSFLNTMVVDDMVARKAGLVVAKMDQPSSFVDRIMLAMAAVKRFFLKAGRTNEVLGISTTESIEAIDLTNVDAAMNASRNNIIKNIATGADMPAKLLTQESFVDGFGEGTQDAYEIASYIDRFRIEMKPEYAWMDIIVQHLAWNPEWYKTIQERFPEDYGSVPYEQAFYSWRNSFRTTWPSLIKEEPSEAATIDDTRLKAAIATVQVLAPLLGVAPEEMVKVIQWFCSVVNVNELLFEGEKLVFDLDNLADALAEHKETTDDLMEAENAKPNKPFSGHDSVAFLRDYLTSDARTVGEKIAAVRRR